MHIFIHSYKQDKYALKTVCTYINLIEQIAFRFKGKDIFQVNKRTQTDLHINTRYGTIFQHT